MDRPKPVKPLQCMHLCWLPRARLSAWAHAIALVCLGAAAHAQPPALPSEERLRNIERPPLPSDARLRAVPLPAFPSDADLLNHGVPRLALPAPHASPALDVGAIADQYRQLRSPAPGALAQGDLLIFISFSLPDAVLNALIDQAARAGAVLVMRGLHNNSIKQTLPRVRAALGARRVAWQIDPRLFRAFEVRAVPSFVLTAPHALAASCTREACERPARWASVAGNVSLHAALEQLGQGAPALAPSVAAFKTRLERAR